MPKIHEFFEEQAVVAVKDCIAEAMQKSGATVDDLANMLDVQPDHVEETLDRGLTIRMLARVLFHLGYRPLICRAPLGEANIEQARHWRRS